MDPIDAFYQHLDSETLLKRHGPELEQDARAVLAKAPMARVAGLISLPDSKDAAAIRSFVRRETGSTPPEGLLLGVVPRAAVEHILTAYFPEREWQEEAWQAQLVLPVVVSTRDGFRFGFLGLGASAADA